MKDFLRNTMQGWKTDLINIIESPIVISCLVALWVIAYKI